MSLDQNTKTELTNLRNVLLDVHKSLLEFQKKIYEDLYGVRLSPYELLNLAMTHGDFEWLRLLSGFIVRIDEAIFDKTTNLQKFQKEIGEEVHAAFIDPLHHPAFKAGLEKAVNLDSNLCLQVGELRKQILLN